MQKKLIALVIAGLSGTAFAQTVTIYGVADASFDAIRVSGGGSTVSPYGVAPNADTPSFTRVSTNGSLIGFKGTEDLGGGLSALFQFESNANFDSGAGGGLSTNRDSFVGLSGDFGKVLLGNLTGPTRALANRLDVNTGEGITSNNAVLGKLGGLLSTGGPEIGGTGTPGGGFARSTTTSSVFDIRHTNSVAYISPSFSGFQASALYMANENKSDAAVAKINTSAYDLGLNYENGPIVGGLTYGEVRVKNGVGLPHILLGGTGTDIKLKEFRLGGLYDFGNATLRALYARTKGEDSLNDIKQNVWGIGGTYNVAVNGKLTAQYYQARDLDAGGSLSDTGARFYTLGYEHSLSKRTMLKASYAYLKNDSATSSGGGGGYDFGYNSSGFAGDDLKISGLQVGLRHAF